MTNGSTDGESPGRAEFALTVVDSDGLILTQPPVLAGRRPVTTPDGVSWTFFDVTVDYDVESRRGGALIAWDASARDGSRIGVREYPVMLTSTGWWTRLAR